MSDETKGRRAAEILKDEVFLEAEALAEATAVQQWKNEPDQSKRDALWHQIQALRATRVALEVLVGRGTIAAHKQESRQ
jgi:hypothetical protein